MPLEFPCPACEATLRLGDTGLAGKKIRCPKCKEVITVPAPEPEPELIAEEPEPEVLDPEPDIPPARGKRPSEVTADRPKGRRDPDWDEEQERSRPRRRRPEPASGGNKVLVWILAGVGGVLLLCGGCVTVVIMWVNQAATELKKTGDEFVKAAKDADDARQAQEQAFNKAKQGPHVEVFLGANTYQNLNPTVGQRVKIKAQIALFSTKGKKVVLEMGEPYDGIAPLFQATDLTRDFIADRAGSEIKYKVDKNPFHKIAVEGEVTALQPQRRVVILKGAEGGGKVVLPVDKSWPEQWKQGWVYDPALGGDLVLTSRLTANDERLNQNGGTFFRKVFKVRLEKGNQYTIRMNLRENQFGLDPVLELKDPTGKFLDRNDDDPTVPNTRNSRIDYTCFKSGDYQVVATSLGFESTGDFKLIVSRKAGKQVDTKEEKKQTFPDLWEREKIYEVAGLISLPSRLAVGDERDHVFKDNYRKLFQVRLNAGYNYTIRMNLPAPANLNPFLRLLDPAGKELAFNDDDPAVKNTRDSRIDFSCRQNGVYQVVATSLGANETGNFTLFITRKKSKTKGKDPEVEKPPVANPPRLTLTRKKAIFGVALSPSGSLLSWFEVGDRTAHLWDLPTNKNKGEPATGFQVTSIAFSPDGKTQALGASIGPIQLLNVETLQAKKITGHQSVVQDLMFLPGNKLVSASYDNSIKVWDLQTGKPIKTIKLPKAPVLTRWSEDGRFAAILFGGVQGPPKLWDMETGLESKIKLPPKTNVAGLALSPDGKTLATGVGPGSIVLWDTQTGNQLKTLTGHKSQVLSLCFSADGKTLASGSYDNSARVWNVETGVSSAVFLLPSTELQGLVLSRDGRVLAVFSRDQSIRVWDVPPR